MCYTGRFSTSVWQKVLRNYHMEFFYFRKTMILVQLLLLLSGDVELNPGPPKRGPPKGEPKKEEKKEVDPGVELASKVRFFMAFRRPFI